MAAIGVDLAPSLRGGGEKNLVDKKISISTPKFLMTFFSNRPYFVYFSLSLLKSDVIYNIYDPFLDQKPLLQKQNSFTTPSLTQFVLSHTSNNTTSQNIGARMHRPSPPPQILGDRPPISLHP